MLQLTQLRPWGYRILVELLDPPTTNPAGTLHLPEQVDTRNIAPRLARVLRLPDGRGFSCHCEGCQSVKDPLHDRQQAPPAMDLRKVDLGSISEGDIVLLQQHGGTAVDLRGSGVNLSRHGTAESPVKALLVLAHQVLAVVDDGIPEDLQRAWDAVQELMPDADNTQHQGWMVNRE